MPRVGPHLHKASNGYFYVVWSDAGRSKRESTRCQKRPEAEGYFATWLTLRAEGGAKPRNAILTIGELWALYDKGHVQKNLAAPECAQQSWNNLRHHFADLTPDQIRQATVDLYEQKRKAGAIGRPSVASSIRRELLMLRACLNWNANPKRKNISADVIPAFDLPAEGKPRDRWLKHDEIRRLLDAARAMAPGPALSRGELFLWLALETAARKTAILTLTWDRVDFETNVIHYTDPSRKLTKKRRADVPISDALRPIMLRARNERAGDLVMGTDAEIWSTVQCIAERAGFGDRAAARAAGEKVEGRRNGAKPSATGISPHVLRHTAATHMARRGVPLWIIAKVLGNTLAVVEKHYAKHCPDDLRAAVNLISASMTPRVADARIFD